MMMKALFTKQTTLDNNSNKSEDLYIVKNPQSLTTRWIIDFRIKWIETWKAKVKIKIINFDNTSFIFLKINL